jgi:hypothetical protein
MSIAPRQFFAATAIALGFALACALSALAQTDAPTRVENPRYGFAFTVEANSLVTYPENGDGFSCIHNPQGGGKGTQADYGLLVFGSPMYMVTADEAKAAKLDPPTEHTLTVDDVKTNTRWDEIFTAAMSSHGWKPAGDASVKVVDGATLKTPYFIWNTMKGAKTHYALMYVLIHEDAFVTVQVESSRPLSKAQVEWFTNKLELLKSAPPAPTPAPAS